MLKILSVYDFQFTGTSQRITLKQGIYLFECWGASGSQRTLEQTQDPCNETHGLGGYSKGFIKLNETTTFYVYVGQEGSLSMPTYNSNNVSTVSGGGATDIRYVNGPWYSFDSLKTRIIVAGGGGSGERICGGDGGGLNSTANARYYMYDTLVTTPATQTSGGKPGYSIEYGYGTEGEFGISGKGDLIGGNSKDNGVGGGGGYYGGGGTPFAGSGSGGSSFISGHPGCDAINATSTEDNIIHTGQPNHFSEYVFYYTETISGNQYMLSPNHDLVMGNSGNGFARITSFTPIILDRKSPTLLHSPLAYIFITMCS